MEKMLVAKSRQELGLSEGPLKKRKHTFHVFPERLFCFDGTKKRSSGAMYEKKQTHFHYASI